MSLDALRSFALGATFNVMGVAATITRPAPNNTPVVTTGIWLDEKREQEPFGTDFQKRGARKVFAVAVSAALPNAPRGTVVVAAELEGAAAKTWRVDGYDGEVEPDLMRLILVETA